MSAEEACSAKIPVGEEGGGYEGPEEETQAQPAGAHLDPHGRHAALHGVGAGVWSEEGRGGRGTSQYSFVSHTNIDTDILYKVNWRSQVSRETSSPQCQSRDRSLR